MRFDLSQYETVEQRIRKFYEDNPDGRIITTNQTTMADRSVSTWVVYAQVFLTAGDQANGLARASGLAFEVDGTPGANQTSALENAETSAIGRALANAGYSGSKRASREEMTKANAGVTPQPTRDWLAEGEKILSVTDLRNLYAEAKASGAPTEVLDKLKDYGQILSAGSENQGTGGRVPAGGKGRKS